MTIPPSRSGSVRYVERLWPSPSMWVIAASLALCAWLIVLPIDGLIAIVVAVVVGGGFSAGLVRAAVTVGVADDEVVAGRAHVPVRFVREVLPLDRTATRTAVGPGLDARSMLRIRPWVHTAVRIELADPDDPVPAWVVSTRRPAQFASAVAAAKLADTHN